MEKSLTKTLVFQLDTRGDERRLHDAYLEARWVYNQTVSLAKAGVDPGEISSRLEDDADLVKNSTQRIVAKSLNSVEQYRNLEGYNEPSHTKTGPFPLRMNYEEGYTLTPTDEGVLFRISTKPYKPVEGLLLGSPDAFEHLEHAIESNDWRVGTAEAMNRNGSHELHVTITHKEAIVRDKQDSQTIIGVDINEDCIALAALNDDDIIDSVVIDYPDIKNERHRYFTIQKRMQKAGQTAFSRLVGDKEKRYVHDRLHKVSRQVVEWTEQFESPLLVFEDLNHMRNGIDYGTRMNRRLHSLPFRKVRKLITYKAAFDGIPSDSIDPAYTSQTCSLTECEYTARSNRRKKRFRCKKCGRQDHADRNASVNIAKKAMNKSNRNVPALKRLPNVRKVRQQASGLVDRPAATHDTVRGTYAEDVVGVFN